MKRLLSNLSGWHMHYGSLWAIQWQVNGWLSLGIHLDFKHRHVTGGVWAGQTYGPYIDLHLGFIILSLGWHPIFAGELENSTSVARGGITV